MALERKSPKRGERADRFPMANEHLYHQKERGKDSRGKKKALEDRERRLQPTEELAGGISPMPAAGMPQR